MSEVTEVFATGRKQFSVVNSQHSTKALVTNSQPLKAKSYWPGNQWTRFTNSEEFVRGFEPRRLAAYQKYPCPSPLAGKGLGEHATAARFSCFRRSNRGLHHPAGLQSVVCDVRRQRQKPLSIGRIQRAPASNRHRPDSVDIALSNWEFVSSRAFHLRESESATVLKLTQEGF